MLDIVLYPSSLLDDKGQVLRQSLNATDAHGSQTMDLQSAVIVASAREPSGVSLTSYYPDKTQSLLPVYR